MTLDVVFNTQNGTLSVACEDIRWKIDNKLLVITPATFRIMKDIFSDEKIPAFIVWFGKCVEIVTFDLVFSNDAGFKSFRKLMKSDAFWLTHEDSTFLEFYWGGPGDPFYTGENDQDNQDEFRGLFQVGEFRRDVKSGMWRGPVSFVMGEVVSP